MRVLAAIVLTVGLAVPAAAQQFVYPRPDPSRITVMKDLTYPGTDGPLRFDLYFPTGNAVVPLVITCNVGIQGMKNWPGYVGWGEATAGPDSRQCTTMRRRTQWRVLTPLLGRAS